MQARTAWEKVAWSWNPRGEREAGDSIVRNLLLHWFPAKISRPSLSFRYSLWLGTAAATLFFVLTVTGVALMFLYVPSVERAYLSVKDIEFATSYGWFIRGVHRLAAHLMVAVVVLHMARAFLTGAFKNGFGAVQNRPLNWLIGVAMLLVTLFLSFTGYLLPWDQLAYWAVTVGTNIARAAPLAGEGVRYVLLGGHQIEQNALLRFYVLHCFFLPVFLLGLFAWHMWRIRKDGGLACMDQMILTSPEEAPAGAGQKTYTLLGITSGRTASVEMTAPRDDEQEVAASPNLTRRILLVALATLLICAVAALFMAAPLEQAANPNVTPNPAKAPWYFLWLQELVTDSTLKLGDFTVNGALIGGILVPGLLVLLLAAWPYLDRSSPLATGLWFARERRIQNWVFLAIFALVLALTAVGTFMRGPSWNFYWPWEAWPDIPRNF
jgi:cytochrome b-561